MRKTMIKSILAGIAISIGGITYLSCEDKFIGASLFSIGLFMVCTFDLSLYTGKVCYMLDNKPNRLAKIIIILSGNWLGTFISAEICKFTRLGVLAGKAYELMQIKLNDSPLSIFILSMLCNMMIYVGVENYKNNPHQIGKYIGIYLSVVVFIMAGFEHCVANMFYIYFADIHGYKPLLYLLIMILGNAISGIGFARLKGVSK